MLLDALARSNRIPELKQWVKDLLADSTFLAGKDALARSTPSFGRGVSDAALIHLFGDTTSIPTFAALVTRKFTSAETVTSIKRASSDPGVTVSSLR